MSGFGTKPVAGGLVFRCTQLRTRWAAMDLFDWMHYGVLAMVVLAPVAVTVTAIADYLSSKSAKKHPPVVHYPQGVTPDNSLLPPTFAQEEQTLPQHTESERGVLREKFIPLGQSKSFPGGDPASSLTPLNTAGAIRAEGIFEGTLDIRTGMLRTECTCKECEAWRQRSQS